MEPRSYLSQSLRPSESRSLRDLADLNRHFIDLMLSEEATGSSSLLDPCLLARLGELHDPQLDRLATCPYSLFDMHFGDCARWREALAREESSSWPVSAAPDPRAAFALATLLFARQLADSVPDLARLMLGVRNDVAASLAALSLPALTGIAFRYSHWLAARLARHPHFWPDLIDFVRDGTRERRLAARTLGVQHSTARSDMSR